MDICLVRHAEPDWMPGGRHRSDPALSERGEIQASRLAEHAGSWREVDEIWISPALRSQQTAAPLVERLGAPARTLPWLLEVQAADFEGLTREAIRERLSGLKGRAVDEWWAGIPDGEDLRAFTARIVAGWNQEIARLGGRRVDEEPHWRDLPADGRIVVVSHAGTSAASLGHLLGLPPVPWSWERFRLGHAGTIVVRSRKISVGQIFALDRFNDRAHLSRALYTI